MIDPAESLFCGRNVAPGHAPGRSALRVSLTKFEGSASARPEGRFRLHRRRDGLNPLALVRVKPAALDQGVNKFPVVLL